MRELLIGPARRFAARGAVASPLGHGVQSVQQALGSRRSTIVSLLLWALRGPSTCASRPPRERAEREADLAQSEFDGEDSSENLACDDALNHGVKGVRQQGGPAALRDTQPPDREGGGDPPSRQVTANR